jgi:hypothetical protein
LAEGPETDEGDMPGTDYDAGVRRAKAKTGRARGRQGNKEARHRRHDSSREQPGASKEQLPTGDAGLEPQGQAPSAAR